MEQQKKIDNVVGFESISGKSKKFYSTPVNNAIDKVYISIHKYGSKDKKDYKPCIAFYFGKNVCIKARFLIGDYIEVLYNKSTKRWLFRRTNDPSLGYKLGQSGGKGGSGNIFVIKCTYNKNVYPEIGGELLQFKEIVIDERGVFCF